MSDNTPPLNTVPAVGTTPQALFDSLPNSILLRGNSVTIVA